MQAAFQEQQRPRRKILRPSSSLNSVNLINGSRISKLVSPEQRKLQENNKTKPQITFKQTEINEQLQREIINIEQCLMKGEHFFQELRQKRLAKGIRQQLFQLEENIVSKDHQIKLISEEVNHLKNINSSSKTLPKNNNSREEENSFNETAMKNSAQSKEDDTIIFKLASQLKSQGEFLSRLLSQHKAKSQKLANITQMVQNIEEKFIERCQQTKERPMRYQEFKELNEEKKKEFEVKAQKRLNRQKPVSSSIKEMNFVFNTENIKPQRDPNAKKSLKDLQSRKVIAQQALRNARKKHNHELTELMAKIQFLRDQDTILLQKIKEKEEQKTMLQTKFNEGTGGSFHVLHTQRRMMSPNSRNSRDNRLMRIQPLNFSNKTNNYLSSPTNNSRSAQSNHYSPHRRLVSARKLQIPHQQINTVNNDYDMNPIGNKFDDYEAMQSNSNKQKSVKTNQQTIEHQDRFKIDI